MIKLREARLYVRRFPLRRPFRFGIVELTELEHLVVAGHFEIDGVRLIGYAGENLVPRWFVKNPSLSIEDEIALMRRAIRAVADAAIALPPAATPFAFWWQLHRHVRAAELAAPPLLAQLAESLIERASLDACAQFYRLSLRQLLASERLGFEPHLVHPELSSSSSQTTHGDQAVCSLLVRHTVGLADDFAAIPSTLRPQKIRGLKIKLSGDAAFDAQRISNILVVCQDDSWKLDRVTVDGNENYKSTFAFQSLIALLPPDVVETIAWIEQPFHRDIALTHEVGELLARESMPPMIIDESDATLGVLPLALRLGYAGTTHKNCKGVLNSLLHRMLLDRERTNRRRVILSGEDLTIVAPWSQASDLIVAAAVNVVDIERNGQHFADGLSGFGEAASDQALMDYPGLYQRRRDGAVELRIEDGCVAVPDRVASAPPLNFVTELL